MAGSCAGGNTDGEQATEGNWHAMRGQVLKATEIIDGDVTHVAVAMNDTSLFNDDPRAISMERATVSERGEMTASSPPDKTDSMQR